MILGLKREIHFVSRERDFKEGKKEVSERLCEALKAAFNEKKI